MRWRHELRSTALKYVKVDIIGLSTAPSSGGSAHALILGEVVGDRKLPIIIGIFEAQAIALEMEKIQPPRPMTHDLLRDLLEGIKAEVTEIVIDELRDGTFFAKICYTHNGKTSHLDSRPSDAVALAVRVGAPIYVAPDVMNDASIRTERTAAPSAMSRLEQMEHQLDVAVKEENYEKAAELRDEIRQLQSERQQN